MERDLRESRVEIVSSLVSRAGTNVSVTGQKGREGRMQLGRGEGSRQFHLVVYFTFGEERFGK